MLSDEKQQVCACVFKRTMAYNGLVIMNNDNVVFSHTGQMISKKCKMNKKKTHTHWLRWSLTTMSTDTTTTTNGRRDASREVMISNASRPSRDNRVRV